MRDLREWLGPIADELIPAEGTMPSATEAGVAEDLLEVVLAVRPNLEPRLRRAQDRTDRVPPEAIPALLADQDPDAYDALVETVAGAYYSAPEIRARLGYTGGRFEELPPPNEPEYVTEGLLDRVGAHRPRPTLPGYGIEPAY